MKPEMTIQGREASPAEYAQLRDALLASQAATPTARACAGGNGDAPMPRLLDALVPEISGAPAAANDGDRPVYPRTSAFLEGGQTIASASAAPSPAAPSRHE